MTTQIAAKPTLRRKVHNVTHGSTAKKLFLPSESPEEFFELLDDAFALYQPCTKRDAALVCDTVEARWFLLRRQRAYDDYEYGLCLRKPDVSLWTMEEDHSLRLLDRYKIAAERALGRALSNTKYISKTHPGPKKSWRELHGLEKKRYQLKQQPEGAAA